MKIINNIISYSGKQTYSQCQRKRHFELEGATAIRRSAALICGAAGHRVIEELHEGAREFIEILCADAINVEVMSREAVPVYWGKGDPLENRAKRTETLIEIITAYWEHNKNARILSLERNFWVEFEHPALEEKFMLTGRFDSLRLNDRDEVEIWEYKTGVSFPITIDSHQFDAQGYLTSDFNAESLERDDQVIFQAVAFKYGYVACQKMDYVGQGDERYHDHEFEEVGPAGMYRCIHCPGDYKFQKFNKGWPARVVRHHPYGYVPLKTKSKDGRQPGDQRFPTIFEMTWDEEMYQTWRDKTAAELTQYLHSIRTGCWLPTGKTGFMGACDDCGFIDQCKSKVASVRIRK